MQTAEELAFLLARYDINTHVDTFRFRFPASFEERLVKVPFSGTMLRVFTLSNEDLAISKIIAWRRRDIEDLKGMLGSGNIDMRVLREITDDVAELRANLDESEWTAFKLRVDEMEGWAKFEAANAE